MSKEMLKDNFFYLFFFVFLFLNVNFSFASSAHEKYLNENNKEEIDIVKIYKSFLENVKIKKLKNGLTIIMYKRGFAPVFSGIISVRVGGSDEIVGKTSVEKSLILKYLLIAENTKSPNCPKIDKNKVIKRINGFETLISTTTM